MSASPASAPHFTIHIAGPMVDGLQCCSRCGEVLVNYEGAMTPDPGYAIRGWREGAFVGSGPGCTVLMDRDAQEIDEIACGGLLQ